MQQTVDLNTLVQVIAVILFVLVAVAVLLVVDGRARLRAGVARDRFGITGRRLDHPIWSWMVSAVLWSVIGTLAVLGARSIWNEVLHEPESRGALLDVLEEGQRIEHRRTFHNAGVAMKPGDKTVCHDCHGDYPHSQTPMVRTLLNMHTQFLGCLTCHADPARIPEEELAFEWLNFSGVEVNGVPFGTDYDPASGGLVETDDVHSKIVLYRVADGQKTLLEIPASRPDASEFIALRSALSNTQLGAAKLRFHVHVKPTGRMCTRCHATERESYIPLRQLGFSPDRVAALTNLNIIGIVRKYRDFHIPNISREGLAAEPPSEPPAVDDHMKEDPRKWWQDRYDAPPSGKGERR